jgi:hypothetical protein
VRGLFYVVANQEYRVSERSFFYLVFLFCLMLLFSGQCGRVFYVGECGVRDIKRPVGTCILHGQGESRQQGGFGQKVKIEEIEFQEAEESSNRSKETEVFGKNPKTKENFGWRAGESYGQTPQEGG